MAVSQHSQASATRPHIAPRAALWHIAALAAVCFLVYANSLTGAFVWDDELQIVKNPTIRALANIPSAFTTPFWGFANGSEANRTNFYRPLQTVAYSVGYAVGDLSPVTDHVISVSFHALACVFLYLICIELAFAPGIALLAAALFAVHPIHTEAVTWIAGLPDVACGAFYFAAIWAFLKSAGDRRILWLSLSAVLFLAALFSKEMAITLPVILFLFTFRPGSPPARMSERLIALAPFAAVTVVYLLMRAHALGFLATTHLNAQATWIDWISLGFYVFGQYLWYAIVPYPLIAYHLVPIHFADRAVFTIVAFLIVAALGALAWSSRRRIPEIWFWLTAFAVLLIPVFYFKGISMTFLAERYLYIPSFAAILLAAALISRNPSTNLIRAGWAVVAIFAVLTVARNRDWSDSEHLYTVSLAADPDIAHFHINLADILMNRGDDAGARRHFEFAVQSLSRPIYVQVPYDRYRAEIGVGALDARAHNYAQAKTHFENALRIYPEGDWGYLYLGGISLEADNDYPRAIEYFKKAIQLGPLNEVARDYLGIAMMNQGKYKEAAQYFAEAVRINPTDQDARKHLDLANRSIAP